MQRRTFFRGLLAGFGAAAATPLFGATRRSVLIQESPVAGFQFHRGESIWSSLGIGNKLTLVREASNPHDADAVAVYFRNDKLGYVPRSENRAVARMLDRGERLEASISELTAIEDPWQRIRFKIMLV